MNHYKELAAIDVSKYVEKKGPHKLDYLSWAVAVDFLMKADPTATWQFNDPQEFAETLMVSCTVTAFGKPITMHLPVMDHTNKAVKNPDAFIVNKNMMRCLVKAIACHGLGISVYAGEDLPNEEPAKEVKVSESVIVDNITAINEAENIDELKKIFTVAISAVQPDREAVGRVTAAKDRRKAELQARLPSGASVLGKSLPSA